MSIIVSTYVNRWQYIAHMTIDSIYLNLNLSLHVGYNRETHSCMSIEKSKKLSGEQIQSRVESIVANQLASGAIQEAGVPELKQNIRNYFQRTSGANKYTYEKQGEDKMVMTRASKNTSGEFVEREPVTLTRKKE